MCPYPWYNKKSNVWLPCGRCGACLKRKISDYSSRLQIEWRFSDDCYFVTLTYEKDPVQLYKKDLQRFFKRLRKVGFQFSYFALGDYGDTFGRPHYHILFFSKGYFNPDYLWSLWVSGDQTRVRGFVQVSPVSLGRIAYVVRYGFLAKLDFDKRCGKAPPFFLMSRRPALGSGYLTKAKIKWHRSNQFWYYPDGRYKKPLPRYWRDKIFPGKLEREKNSLLVSVASDQERERYFQEFRKQGSTNPYEKWIERLQNNANVYLDGLRKQKKLKNKLL